MRFMRFRDEDVNEAGVVGEDDDVDEVKGEDEDVDEQKVYIWCGNERQSAVATTSSLGSCFLSRRR